MNYDKEIFWRYPPGLINGQQEQEKINITAFFTLEQ
jgi:hypothetical protein